MKFRAGICILAMGLGVAAATSASPESSLKPLHQVQIIALIAGGTPIHRVAMLVTQRGTDFDVEVEYLLLVRQAGGDEELIETLKKAKVTNAPATDPDAQARTSELLQHVAHGSQFFQQHQYANAQFEFRAAVRLDSESAYLHITLSRALNAQKKMEEAMVEAREALRLDPRSGLAHYTLGNVLLNKDDLEGAIAEYREALRLDPTDDLAHHSLGNELAKKGDVDGAIAEYREALRLNPNNAKAHVSLGVALGKESDWEGEISEEREALRLDPNNPFAHNDLGVALEKKGDLRGALEEYRAALTLDPQNVAHQQNYEHVWQQLNNK